MEETLELSVVGMCSGVHTIEGIKLINFNNLEIAYENDMVVTVAN
jgi:hypothetical protein